MPSFTAICAGAGVVASGLIASYLARKVAAAPTPTLVERPAPISQVATFPWGGTEPFTMKLLPHCFALGAATTAAAIALTVPSGPMNTLELARGPVLITLYWVWGFYNCLASQVKMKMGGGTERAAKVAERSMMNTLEQGVPFLTLLWATAGCVDAALATSCGFTCAPKFHSQTTTPSTLHPPPSPRAPSAPSRLDPVTDCLFRSFYGFAYSYFGGFSMLVEAVTQPNYCVIHLFAAQLLCFGCGGGSLLTLPYIGQNFLAWFALLFVGNGFALFVGWDFPAGAASAVCNLAYNKEKGE